MRRSHALLLLPIAFALMGQQECAVPLATTASVGSDADGDLVPDQLDNCRFVPNRSQRETAFHAADCVGSCSSNPTEPCSGDADCATPGDTCILPVPEIDASVAGAEIVFGICRNDPGVSCLIDRDCAVGDACDCDFTGDGVCNISDYNVFYADYLAGTDTASHGTDMTGDGAVDAVDFDVFEPLFAAGAPGEGAARARVLEDDLSPGACYDRRQGRRLWQSEGRMESYPNSTSNDLLDCSVPPQSDLVFLGIDFTPAHIQAMQANKNNPTDAFVNAASGGHCPSAVFSTGNKLAPRACDAHDLCLDHCGYDSEDCDRQFYRDLFNTCHSLPDPEAFDCMGPCLDFATMYASHIAGRLILSPPPGPSSDPDAVKESDLANCQCGPPVCERNADCLNQSTAPVSSVCERGYCVHRYGNENCTTDADCGPGYRCEADQCIWDVRSLPDRRGTPPPVCGDGICQGPVETCAATSCPEDCGIPDATNVEGFGRCGIGDACLNDLDCADGACLRGQCRRLADGSVCDEITDCEHRCDPIFGTCTASCAVDSDCREGGCYLFSCVGLQDDFALCDSDADCASDLCNAGVCIPGALPNGYPCTSNRACQSSVCNFPICIEANSVPGGSTCTTDAACASGNCIAGLCEGSCGDGICVLVPDGEVCGGQNSGLECNRDCGKCPNGTPCIDSGDCQSGFCAALVCANPPPYCGDGKCNGTEKCGNANSGLECNQDCGLCNAGEICVSDSDCSGSLVCFLGLCVPDCTKNGGVCLFDGDCCSDDCHGIPPTCH